MITYQRLAEVCGQYLQQGKRGAGRGTLQMREWTTPQGEKQKRLELRGESVHFLERKPADEDAAVPPRAGRKTA